MSSAAGSKGKGKTKPRKTQTEPTEWRLTAVSHECADGALQM